MIRPLRQRHRMVVFALGVLLPAAFAAGIAWRRPVPTGVSVPGPLANGGAGFGEVVWTRADLWHDPGLITHLRRNAAGDVAVELRFRDLVRPDVLLYWAAGKDLAGGSLPEDARLLGALSSGVPLPVPSGARGVTGRFLLYSLADHAVVASSNPFILRKD